MFEQRTLAGETCSILGYGTMRFPKNEDGTINEPEAEKLLDESYKAGVNYFDTARPYHNGMSEPFVGKVMSKYPRESYFLADKLPLWSLKTKEEAVDIFLDQLKNLRTDYVDFYLFHCLNEELWDKVVKLNLIPVFENFQKQGKIHHLGFSFHDEYNVFEKIITSRKWDFCQLQVNYMDRDIQAGPRGRDLAEALGVPVVVMEPIKGGALAGFADEINDIFYAADPNASVASWALRWVASQPNIKVVLSGMSSAEQVEDNIKTMQAFRPLSGAEFAVIENAVRTIKAKVKNGCTGCRYCVPCPFGVDIPGNFAIWNHEAMYGGTDRAKRQYARLDDTRASLCHNCGACLAKCPQHITIPDNLAEVAQRYE